MSQLRLKATVTVNSTAPGATLKVGLYPVTASGGVDDRTNITLGTVVNEVTFSGLAANSRNYQVGSDFSVPSDGFYVLAVNVSGSNIARNSLPNFLADLQVRNVP